MTDPDRDFLAVQIGGEGHDRRLGLAAQYLMLFGINVFDVQENQVGNRHQTVEAVKDSRGIRLECDA